MSSVRRVLLVQPQSGARWRSITAYAESLQALLEGAGLEVATAEAPWFNPPSAIEGLRSRWTVQPNVRRAEEGAFDVVHLTDHALAHHVRRFAPNAAVVVTCHDLMPFTTPGYYAPGPEGPIKRFFLRRSVATLKGADVTVAVSEFTSGEAERFAQVPKERIVVVPNVVRDGFAPMERATAEARLVEAGVRLPPRQRLLSVGNDRAYKNLPALLEAMARPELAEAELVRVGPLTKAHRAQIAQLGLGGRLSEVSGLDDSLLGALYAACDVLAQPSIAEGFGIPVIEAMACGLPVVVSDGGALPEVAGGAATVVHLAGDDFPGRLAAALQRTMDAPDHLVAAGLGRASEFSPEAVTPRLLAAYEAAFARRNARK